MSRSLKFAIGSAFVCALLTISSLPGAASDSRTVRVYVDGQEQAVSTDLETVGDVLRKLEIEVSEHDFVEPPVETNIDEGGFHINVFRARPVMVVDGAVEKRVYTAHQSPQLIAEAAGLTVYDEDLYTLEAAQDFVDEGFVGQKLTVDRATPVNLFFDGEKVSVRTHLKTVQELLKEQGVTVGEKDTLNVNPETKLSDNLDVIVTRVGRKLVTVKEKVPFETRVIYDNTKPADWEQIQQKGSSGERVVTYEVVEHDGKEVKRTKIQSVIKAKPVEEVIKRGNQSVFSGSMAVAFARLRQCESGGNYANKNNPTYRGAYQFSYTTWAAMGGSGDPANAPPSEQDYRAKLLQQRSGWGQWPHCSSVLGLR